MYKRILQVIVLILSITKLSAQTPFITVWKSDNPGGSSTNEIRVPATGGFNYYFEQVGNPSINGTGSGSGNTTITFPTANTYRLSITPTTTTPFSAIRFTGSFEASDRQKILAVEQWGSVVWTNVSSAYSNCPNLTVTATDIPDLSLITSMTFMFNYCTSLTNIPNINNWNVSNVKTFNYMFYRSGFNSNISNWNMTNAENTSYMFYDTPFNQDISGWNVSNVTAMEYMFRGTTAFNQTISAWNVNKVANFSGMFALSKAFNQNIGNWNIKTGAFMTYMFYEALAFNQNLGSWNVTTSLDGFFSLSGMNCQNYSKTLQGWAGNASLPNNLDLSSSGITYSYFGRAARNTLITSKNWTISGDNLNSFCGSNPYITLWKSDNTGGSGTNQINVPAIGSFDYYYEQAGNPSINGTGSSTGNTTITFPSASTYRLYMIPTGTTPFNVIRFTGSFGISDRLKILAVEQWGDVVWTSMNSAYSSCSNLTVTATDAPNLSLVTTMTNMFSLCTSVTTIPNANNWNVSNVKEFNYLFNKSGFNSYIGNWNMSSAENTSYMFYDTPFNQDISAWNVSNVSRMEYMFRGAKAFNQNLSSWNVSKVADFQAMFALTDAFNQNIGNWVIKDNANLTYMFYEAKAFNQNLGNWNITSSLEEFLSYSGLDCQNYSLSLVGWANNSMATNIPLGATGRNYSSAIVSSRNSLIADSWNITGDAVGTCSVTPLPVSLTNFTVVNKNNSAYLSWTTQSEINNTGFHIEHSYNGNDFTNIGFVKSASIAGNSSLELNYFFTDNNLNAGKNYYRLKQVDKDGKFTFSDVKRLDINKDLITVSPNPFQSTITLTNLNDANTITISNNIGAKLLSVTTDKNTKTKVLNLSTFPGGLYFVNIQSGNGSNKRIKIVKL